MSGRFLEGVTSSPGSTKSAGLPNITGNLETASFGAANTNIGAGFFKSSSGSIIGSGSSPYVSKASATLANNFYTSFNLDASKSSSIYGNSSTVQPKSYTVLYIMKIKA